LRPATLLSFVPRSGEAFGILLRIAATLAFAAMGACIKALGNAVPLGQVVFFRSAFALIPLVAFLCWSGAFPQGLATTRPFGHAARCLLGATAMFTSFATIRLLPLAEATMLSYLAPALMALMGWALLGERLDLRRTGGVALGLAGGAVFSLPALTGSLPDGALPGLVLGLVTAILTAGALIQVRRLTMLGEAAGAIAFWFAVVSAFAGAATLPMGWTRPDGLQLVLLLSAGLSGGVAHILMVLSFRHAEAVALAPYEYLSVLWAVTIGLMIFTEPPGWSFVLAAPLILSGAVIAVPSRRSRSTVGSPGR
jgi:drug/metabolite transporter (DMT)-like permease